ncbi:hypothetical protein BC351_14755 [Paenibacillus ferrarius]|uniref:Glycosyltransferase 2-like domain-containing protein n=1 Tax=Paenibacillus ferrarius TaxID=1469647 RepID=A0A1V4HRC5_9BACL|nr:glycosyltransferase [Paenibacillus ferrarius]OPH61205.1 hypothetical protein BC351_14755 [Paenibacillus ferrarius]
MQPLVSVVIPFYNCPYVEQAILSALHQTYASIEVVLVNDGSTQHTDLLKPYLNKIKYIEKENGGTATALNAGIKKANGDYVSWLSSDDFIHSEKISKQISLLQQRSGRFCHTSYAIIDSENQVTSRLNGMNFPEKKYLVDTLIKGCVINGSTVLIKNDVFSSIGYFDEKLPYAHDYDMWLRMLPHYEFSYIHEDLTFYRVHDRMGSKRYAKDVESEVKHIQDKHRQSIRNLASSLKNS